MKNITTYLSCLGMGLSVTVLTYADPDGYFSHQDWEIICDNIGTCRAAGYQPDSDATPASILLTRKAGARQSVTAEFALSNADQDHVNPAQIRLVLNQTDLGKVIVEEQGDELIMGKLSTTQVQALLKHARQKQQLHFKAGQQQWHISDAGLSAVLLKMDDQQKRVGTVGALIKKGNQSELHVLAAKAVPIVQYKKISPQIMEKIQPSQSQYHGLARILSQSLKQPEDCNVLSDEGTWSMQARQPIEIRSLGQDKVLISTLCWRGAYNEGYGYWMMNKNLKGTAQNITSSASDFSEGKIYSAQKGRGIGDCWSVAEWVWNGQNFVQTSDYWTGMCKQLAPGGVWELKKLDTVVKDK